MHLHWSTTGTAIFVFLPHPPRPCPTTAFVAVYSLGVSLGSRSHAEFRKKVAACDASREQSTRSDRSGRCRREIDRDFRMTHNNSRECRPLNSLSLFLVCLRLSLIYLTRLDIYLSSAHVAIDLTIKNHVSRVYGSALSPCAVTNHANVTHHAFAEMRCPLADLATLSGSSYRRWRHLTRPLSPSPAGALQRKVAEHCCSTACL